MPFKSKAQMRMMYAKHPQMAARWMKEQGGHMMPGTPERVKPKPKPKAKAKPRRKAK